uniref:Uncharacterized protein n=1 Tax=Romanomermis culicivorax TaxID=13658 RepID=A0A915L629_ROMCU
MTWWWKRRGGGSDPLAEMSWWKKRPGGAKEKLIDMRCNQTISKIFIGGKEFCIAKSHLITQLIELRSFWMNIESSVKIRETAFFQDNINPSVLELKITRHTVIEHFGHRQKPYRLIPNTVLMTGIMFLLRRFGQRPRLQFNEYEFSNNFQTAIGKAKFLTDAATVMLERGVINCAAAGLNSVK